MSEMCMSVYCSSRIYIRIYISQPREHFAPKLILEWFITHLPSTCGFPILRHEARYTLHMLYVAANVQVG
jgi:hypothetical protein